MKGGGKKIKEVWDEVIVGVFNGFCTEFSTGRGEVGTCWGRAWRRAQMLGARMALLSGAAEDLLASETFRWLVGQA